MAGTAETQVLEVEQDGPGETTRDIRRIHLLSFRVLFGPSPCNQLLCDRVELASKPSLLLPARCVATHIDTCYDCNQSQPSRESRHERSDTL